MNKTQKKASDFSFSEEQIKHLLSSLFEDSGLQLVILFGSAASGRIHKHSDIDLAFLFDKPIDIIDLTNRIISLLRTDSVDIIDLRRSSPLLRFSAIRQCKLLYEKEPGMFNAFVSLVFRMYVDTKKLRDAQALSIMHFIHEKGLA